MKYFKCINTYDRRHKEIEANNSLGLLKISDTWPSIILYQIAAGSAANTQHALLLYIYSLQFKRQQVVTDFHTLF